MKTPFITPNIKKLLHAEGYTDSYEQYYLNQNTSLQPKPGEVYTEAYERYYLNDSVAQLPAPGGATAPKNNMLMYGGIAAAVLLIVMLIIKS